MNKTLTDKISFFIATWFYSGIIPKFAFFPKMPGTWGTILAFLIFYFLPNFSIQTFSIITVLVFFIGVWASNNLEKIHGEDPQFIVIDEAVGFLVSVIVLPKSFLLWALGVALFRLFDIWKPYPIRNFEKFPNGFGVMLDDVIAGVYTNLSLHILFYFLGNEILKIDSLIPF
ncbi:MAG: phosphatidylglycerophosphatase A [Calditrichaeota bacterium]|nr:MAG: phosphatidylglycerophosphatase A [Calditrichota bacterium]